MNLNGLFRDGEKCVLLSVWFRILLPDSFVHPARLHIFNALQDIVDTGVNL